MTDNIESVDDLHLVAQFDAKAFNIRVREMLSLGYVPFSDVKITPYEGSFMFTQQLVKNLTKMKRGI